MQFSLSFFSSTGTEFRDSKYAFLTESSRFADRNGFAAVWTPERHFHPFGGIFPNPALMGVLLATTTSRIRIRAGSVVLPLHHPIRVAEEWSVVDNLSRGRVDLAFAVGWNPNDFVLAPERYADRVAVTFSGIETVKKLWRGEEFTGPNGLDEATSVRIQPLPVQKELPTWITCTGKSERFIQAGRKGFNVLTALIFQPVEKLAQRIAEYRATRQENGHDPQAGRVTLMIHTFVGNSMPHVRKAVRIPMIQYLKSSVDLWRQENSALGKLTEREDALEFAFERYFTNSGLFGTMDTCAQRVEELRRIGVDEIACLIDYGVDEMLVSESLKYLNRVRKLCDNS